MMAVLFLVPLMASATKPAAALPGVDTV